MRKDAFLVEGVNVETFSLQEASTRICDDVSAGKAFSVFTLNLDHIVKLRRNETFRAAYQRARIILADGFPIVLSGRLQGRSVARTTGADLIEPLCAEASNRGLPILLFGSTFETLTSTARRLKQTHPQITIAGVYAPQHGLDVLSDNANEGIEFIKNSGAGICFVALGAPKQEIFSDRCAQQMNGISFICIGAGLDFIAGHQRRAPKLIQSMGCEWLWRVANDPRRLARRYLECLSVFPGVVLEGLARR